MRARNVALPGNSGPAGASALTPPQVASLYNFPTNNAAGQPLAFLNSAEATRSRTSSAFLKPLGITTLNIVDQSVDGGANSPAGSATNVPSDNTLISRSTSISTSSPLWRLAPTSSSTCAEHTEQSVVNALSQAVHDSTNAPSIVTYSWFSSEDSWNASARTSVANTLNDAAALGVTVFFITGDDGSDDDVGDGFAHVAYPASEFGCVACGGTYISNVSGSSFDEGTWNDVGATGGGVSDVYGLPSWQDNIGVPKSANNGTTVGRGVPDVSGNASAFSGYDLILYGSPPPD